MRVRVFLRHPLFTPRTGAHVPSGATVLEGSVKDREGGWLELVVESYLNDSGKVLEGAATTLLIPAYKVDHMLVLGG
jgi:hypothetical protein